MLNVKNIFVSRKICERYDNDMSKRLICCQIYVITKYMEREMRLQIYYQRVFKKWLQVLLDVTKWYSVIGHDLRDYQNDFDNDDRWQHLE